MPQYPTTPVGQSYLDALAKLKGLYPGSSSSSTPTVEDPSYPKPPLPPVQAWGASAPPRLSADTAEILGGDVAPQPQDISDYIKEHSDFGKMGGAGDDTALAPHSAGRLPDIALEGLQQARKSEAEDRQRVAVRTNDPSEAAFQGLVSGGLDRDLNTSPLARYRESDYAAEASNADALQKGIGLPPGAIPTPGQAAAMYQRRLEATKANSNLAVAQAEGASRERVAGIQNQGATQNIGFIQQLLAMHPELAGSAISVGKASIKPPLPNQMVPAGGAKGAEEQLISARKRIAELENPNPLFSPLQSIRDATGMRNRAQLLADAKANEALYEGQLGIPHGAPIGPSGPQPGGVPPEIQHLQPGQKAVDPTTGETWINTGGQIKRIR